MARRLTRDSRGRWRDARGKYVAAPRPKKDAQGRWRGPDGKYAAPPKRAKTKAQKRPKKSPRSEIPAPGTLSGLPISPTFRQYVEPITGRRKAQTYAIIEIEFQYADAPATKRAIPFPVGMLSPSEARKLSPDQLADFIDLSGLPEPSRVHGLVRLRPDRERKGKRLAKRKKRKR